MITAFEAFSIFTAIKTHFTEKTYDAFKYEFATKVSYDKFLKRKDRHLFEKVVKKYTTKDLVTNYFLANIITNPDHMWIGECEEDNYLNWKKRVEGLTYNFKNDCLGLVKTFQDPKYMFQGYPPNILNEYLGERITLETITIFNSFTGIIDKMEDENIFSTLKLTITKYKPFIKFDSNNMAMLAHSIFEGKQH